MKYFALLFASLSVGLLASAQSDSLFAEQPETFVESDTVYSGISLNAFVDSIENSLQYEYGEIQLMEDVATIYVPEGYKYLNGKQSRYVLSDLWGNPEDESVLGLLFPEDIGPLSDNFTYAIEISYAEEGYIEDEEAEDIDYDELLEQMQEEATAENPERIKQGYPKIELVGWASEPFYDQANKKLHWAKELKFDDAEMNTLNYNIRILGRKGYLTLNVIGDMEVLPMVKDDIDPILASVEFNDGYHYDDFNPDIDQVAAYGIGGLIAGKVLAKAGMFAMLAKFWKVIAVGTVGAFGFLRKKLFGGGEGQA